MRSAPLFHLECAPVVLADGFHYVVLSVLQGKTPNLDPVATGNKQRFAVLYHQPLEESFAMEILEQAHIHGALSGVKLVAVHKDTFHLFLGNDVAGTTLPAIESLWEPVKNLAPNRRLALDYSCEAEVYSERSDFAFWPAVKEVLESNTLGIERYSTPMPHDCEEKIFNGDDLESHKFHMNILQHSAVQPVTPIGTCSMDLLLEPQTAYSRCLMANLYDKQKEPGA